MSHLSSSSDSDEEALLKEALVPGFTIESVQKKSLPKPNTVKAAAKTLKSLRSVADEPTDQDFRAVDISPHHQKFIAKKLEELLDGQLQEVDTLTKAWKDKPVKRAVKKGGVRLLAASRRSIKCVDEVDSPVCHNSQHKPKKHKQKKLIDDLPTLSESEKLREAAVSPEWVLEGRGVFGKNCYRGEVITGAVHSWTTNKTSSGIKTEK